MCLEEVVQKKGLNISELNVLLTKMWEVTNSEKLGCWEDLLIENNPRVVIDDYKAFKVGRFTFEELGFTTLDNIEEFEERVNFLSKLPSPIPELIDELATIANQNLFGGCGEYSELTLKPTIEFINILDSIFDYERPKIELVEFSKFSENYGWGNKFTKEKIKKN